MSDNILPFDIQREIIKRVSDAKSLLRFRAVSKPWKSFIDSPEFIAFYGARNTQPQSLLLSFKENTFSYYVSLDDDYMSIEDEFGPTAPLLIKNIRYLHVIGSSCGLWSLHNYIEEMVVIWNPSIRKSIGIVVPDEMTEFGFGVCPLTYDPTIVGMSFRKKFMNNNIISSVGIFTLSSKTWKMLPSSNVPRESIELEYSTPVTIDRFIYWDVSDRIVSDKSLILSFDLITHEFKELDLPVSITNEVGLNISISKLNESLVLCGIIDEVNDERVYGVWVMGDVSGAMTSFTKLFNIKIPDLAYMKLLGFRENGEPIIETAVGIGEFSVLKVYEPCSEHITDLDIYGENGTLYICPYKETLLLADHSDGCIISNDY